ncbi:MAG: hypothetical protein ACTFAL_05095 [Candidatus Electronema sp. V4]|uniref:hypothetical protein n=1 Tax=Candidatus Electronema sp. V4 TaxID=3454756 RepID=UPI004055499D
MTLSGSCLRGFFPKKKEEAGECLRLIRRQDFEFTAFHSCNRLPVIFREGRDGRQKVQPQAA